MKDILSGSFVVLFFCYGWEIHRMYAETGGCYGEFFFGEERR